MEYWHMLTPWMNLDNIMIREKSQTQKTTYYMIPWFCLYEISRIGKFTKTENRLVVPGLRRGRNGEWGVCFGGDEYALELVSGNGCTTLWIHQNHWIVKNQKTKEPKKKKKVLLLERNRFLPAVKMIKLSYHHVPWPLIKFLKPTIGKYLVYSSNWIFYSLPQ